MNNIAFVLACVFFLLPSYVVRFSFFGLPTTLLEIFLLVLVASWAICHRKHTAEIKKFFVSEWGKNKIFFVGAGAFLLASVISVFVAPSRHAAFGLWRAYFLEPTLVAILFYYESSSRARFKLFLSALGLSALVVSVIAVAQVVLKIGLVAPWNGVDQPIRATSIFPFPNAIGLYVAPIATLFSVMFLQKIFSKSANTSKKELFFACVVAIFGFAAIFLAKSRGAIMGAVVALVIVGLWSAWRWRVLGTVFFVVALIFLLPQTRIEALHLLAFKDVSADVRLVLWQGTLRMIQAHPFFGAGLSGFPVLYPLFKEARHVEILQYPHNIVLNFWVETGLLGLISFCVLVWQFFARIWRMSARDEFRAPLAAAMITLLVHGLVDVPYFKNDLAILWWIVVLSPFVIRRFSEKLTK